MLLVSFVMKNNENNQSKQNSKSPSIVSNHNLQQHQPMVVAQSFTGPLPHPDILLKYKQIIPDAPERILKMAEKSNDHLIRVDIEKIATEKEQVKRGQRFSLTAVFFVICLCTFAIYHGAYTTASILGGLDLVGMILAFAYGKQNFSFNKGHDH